MLQSDGANETLTINNAALLFQIGSLGLHDDPHGLAQFSDQLGRRAPYTPSLRLEQSARNESLREAARLEEARTPELRQDRATLGEDPELVKALAAAIEQLSSQERLIITLYHYEELTLREISEALNLTETQISHDFAQATSRLRQALVENSGAAFAQTAARVSSVDQRASVREQAA